MRTDAQHPGLGLEEPGNLEQVSAASGIRVERAQRKDDVGALIGELQGPGVT